MCSITVEEKSLEESEKLREKYSLLAGFQDF